MAKKKGAILSFKRVLLNEVCSCFKVNFYSVNLLNRLTGEACLFSVSNLCLIF